jgi:protocatechuate 3,4-dioxygenase beta subunit
MMPGSTTIKALGCAVTSSATKVGTTQVKVQAPNQPALTTQLYFPNEAKNSTDGIYNKALAMRVEEVAGGRLATFNFVLNLP